MLSALLSGRALEVYARLSYDEATDYNKVKSALLKRYNTTEKGFRLKFRDSKPEENENPTQFATRLAHYLDRWLDMASVTDYDNLKTLLVREQFLKACPQNVAIHLNEKAFKNMTDLCDHTERYLQAHSQDLTTNEGHTQVNQEQGANAKTDNRQYKECYNCGKRGHIRAVCRNQGGGDEQHCAKCNKYGHKAETCRTTEYGGMLRMKRWTKHTPRRSRIVNSTINLRHGEEQVTPAAETNLTRTEEKINGHRVTTLRDSGCSTVCVNKRLVKPEQLTGIYKTCRLMDGTNKRFETATVNLDTPYIKQDRILVMCIEDLEFGIVIGDIPGVRCKCSPDPNWR